MRLPIIRYAYRGAAVKFVPTVSGFVRSHWRDQLAIDQYLLRARQRCNHEYDAARRGFVTSFRGADVYYEPTTRLRC